MTQDLVHHDPTSINFNLHTIRFGNNSFCMGCSASKLFVHIILPALLFSMGVFDQIGGFEMVFFSLLLGSTIITSIEFNTGEILKSIFLNKIPIVYTSYAIGFTAFQSISMTVQSRILLAIVLAIPQISIYLNKIISQKEFTYRKIKFTSRLFMIIGLYFVTINFVSSPIILGLFIVASGMLFVKLRKFSDYRVNDSDKIAILSPMLSKLLGDNKVRLFKSNVILFGLFLFGLIAIVSNEPSACNNNIQHAGTALVPVIAMSKPNFCPDCGDPVDFNEKFCDNCGRNLVGGSSQSQAQNQKNYNQPYQDNRYSGSGRHYGGNRGNYGRQDSKRLAIGAGIFFFVIGYIISMNFFIAALVAVIAYGGIMLAASTDNCCFQYLIMDCCSDCICSILGSSRRN